MSLSQKIRLEEFRNSKLLGLAGGAAVVVLAGGWFGEVPVVSTASATSTYLPVQDFPVPTYQLGPKLLSGEARVGELPYEALRRLAEEQGVPLAFGAPVLITWSQVHSGQERLPFTPVPTLQPFSRNTQLVFRLGPRDKTDKDALQLGYVHLVDTKWGTPMMLQCINLPKASSSGAIA